MADFDNIPASASLKVRRFRVHIDDDRVKEMQNLVAASKLGPETFESLDETRVFGMSRRWLAEAKTYWEKKFDWRATEARINSFTNYEVAIKDDDGKEYAIHFTGIFSKHPDAIPICMMHGWPGSFLEFLKILKLLTGKYGPDNLPYHVVVPSLPGYAFSTGPPQTKAWFTEDIARIMHKLMVGLGFSSGYVTHGGDIGSFAARIMCVKYEECKAMQLNFCIMVNEPKGVPANALSAQDKKGLERAKDFGEYGNAYARMHATRSSTIGLVLSSSPLALLAWIGEKFLVWTDTDPSIDEILQSVSLYWLTQSFPRAIYPYAQFFGQVTCKEPSLIHEDPKYFCKKPWGYSYFPKELAPVPVAWARTTGNLIWTRTHTEGGHFAAMEKPDILLRDIEDFIEELK